MVENLSPLPEKIGKIEPGFFQANDIVPLGCKDNHLVAVVREGRNGRRPEDALSMFLRMPVKTVPVNEAEFQRYLTAIKEGSDRNTVMGVVGDLNGDISQVSQEISADHNLADDDANRAPIIKFVNLVFSNAIKGRASDIHIQPCESEVRVRFRIDGILYDMYTAPKHAQNAIISRIKVMSSLDVAEKRLPQDGRIKVRGQTGELDVRVSIVPSNFGEQVTMRLLDKQATMVSIDSIGIPDEINQSFKELISRPQGVFLVTGPTGSGKTTTLYAALGYINTPDKNILTVEDPVEYVMQGIGQIQVNPKIGLTFAKTLRSFLRQDPDIIMVGEIRDAETAEIAIQAALTGHLVFSTLHTNDAASGITRLLDMHVEPYLLTSSLSGIVAQRLVRKVCPHCRQVYKPNDFERTMLKQFTGSPDTVTYRGAGCDACVNTGYMGRIGVFEFLPVTTHIRQMIQGQVSSDHLKEQAKREGMKTLREDGIAKAAAGITSLSEVIRVTIE